MGLLLKFLAAPGARLLRVCVYCRKKSVHGFGTEKESRWGRESMNAWAEVPLERRVFFARGRASYGGERRLVSAARVDVRYRLEHGALSASVLADKERHARRNFEPLVPNDLCDGRNCERPRGKVRRASRVRRPVNAFEVSRVHDESSPLALRHLLRRLQLPITSQRPQEAHNRLHLIITQLLIDHDRRPVLILVPAAGHEAHRVF